MKAARFTLGPMGNGQGLRLPDSVVKRYGFSKSVEVEERDEGLLLKPSAKTVRKLSWEETAKQMSAESEDWTEWHQSESDGISELAWSKGTSKTAKS